MTLKQKIEAILALRDKISEGPWGYRYDTESIVTPNGPLAMFGPYSGVIYYQNEERGKIWETIRFIVEMRNNIDTLIAAVKEAADLISMFHQVTEYQQDHDRCGVWLSKYNGGE